MVLIRFAFLRLILFLFSFLDAKRKSNHVIFLVRIWPPLSRRMTLRVASKVSYNTLHFTLFHFAANLTRAQRGNYLPATADHPNGHIHETELRPPNSSRLRADGRCIAQCPDGFECEGPLYRLRSRFRRTRNGEIGAGSQTSSKLLPLRSSSAARANSAWIKPQTAIDIGFTFFLVNGHRMMSTPLSFSVILPSYTSTV